MPRATWLVGRTWIQESDTPELQLELTFLLLIIHVALVRLYNFEPWFSSFNHYLGAISNLQKSRRCSANSLLNPQE